jgi:crotonobetainyl-CoA:carnitine CoA-transferase CaiB-like acyl-CoA transferase
VQSVGEALADPVLAARGGTWSVTGGTFGTVETVPSPLRFSRTPAGVRFPPPALGEHSESVEERGWN